MIFERFNTIFGRANIVLKCPNTIFQRLNIMLKRPKTISKRAKIVSRPFDIVSRRANFVVAAPKLAATHPRAIGTRATWPPDPAANL